MRRLVGRVFERTHAHAERTCCIKQSSLYLQNNTKIIINKYTHIAQQSQLAHLQQVGVFFLLKLFLILTIDHAKHT